MPIWSPRTAEAISIHHARALVYIRKEAIPEDADEHSYDFHKDWGFFVEQHLVAQYEHLDHHDPDMIFIDTDFDYHSHENMLYPSLTAVMPGLKRDDLPNFFVLNVLDWNALEYDRFWKGHTDKQLEYVAYPEELPDEIDELQSEMILHWARKESIKYEIEHFEQEILKEENAEHHDDVTEEEIQEHIDNLNIHLKHSRDELKMLDEDMENLKEQIESGEIDNWEDLGDDFEVDEL